MDRPGQELSKCVEFCRPRSACQHQATACVQASRMFLPKQALPQFNALKAGQDVRRRENIALAKRRQHAAGYGTCIFRRERDLIEKGDGIACHLKAESGGKAGHAGTDDGYT